MVDGSVSVPDASQKSINHISEKKRPANLGGCFAKFSQIPVFGQLHLLCVCVCTCVCKCDGEGFPFLLPSGWTGGRECAI